VAIEIRFISFVVRISTIAQKYPGGWEDCLGDHAGTVGGRVWFDEKLFQDGAMGPAGIEMLVEEWSRLGFEPTEMRDDKEVWKDVCVVDMLNGPTLPCDWLTFDPDRHVAYLAGTEPGEVAGPGNVAGMLGRLAQSRAGGRAKARARGRAPQNRPSSGAVHAGPTPRLGRGEEPKPRLMDRRGSPSGLPRRMASWALGIVVAVFALAIFAEDICATFLPGRQCERYFCYSTDTTAKVGRAEFEKRRQELEDHAVRRLLDRALETSRRPAGTAPRDSGSPATGPADLDRGSVPGVAGAERTGSLHYYCSGHEPRPWLWDVVVRGFAGLMDGLAALLLVVPAVILSQRGKRQGRLQSASGHAPVGGVGPPRSAPPRIDSVERPSPSRGAQAQVTRPTLLIGLGGFGGDVLLRVRRKFHERFGGLDRFPTVGYLYIDTDVSAGALTQASHGIEALGLGFQPSERVEAAIMESNPLYVGKSLEEFPHVADWLDRQIPMPENIDKGAGMIRGLGRLAFFHNFQRISERIQGLGQTITTSTTSPQPVQAYVVCSIAGGTGSGIFLDMAYLVSHLIAGTERRAYLVFPDIFRGKVDASRPRANACAALMELEHYNRHDSTFKVRWQAGAQEFSFPRPPFEDCYLIEGQNMSGAAAPHSEEILEILADNIFSDFSDPLFMVHKNDVRLRLGQYKSLQYSSEQQDSHGAKAYGSRHTCHYQSFGMSKLGLPMDRIVNACTCKLAEDIVDYWGNLSGGTALLPADRTAFAFERFLHPAGLVEGTHSILGKTVRRNDIFNAMISIGDDGRTVRTEIAQWSNEIRDRVARGLDQPLWRFLNDEYGRTHDRFLPAKWGIREEDGEFLSRIESNHEEFLEREIGRWEGGVFTGGAIREHASAMASDQFFGPRNAAEIMREVSRILDAEPGGYISAMRSAMAAQEKKLEAIHVNMLRRLEEVGAIEAWPQKDWRRRQGEMADGR